MTFTKFAKLDGIKLSLFQKAWLLSPVAIWFSYKPIFRLGRNESTNFELSITILYLALLAVIGLPIVWRKRRQLYANKSVWLVSSFVILSAVSILWSSNKLRGALTLGTVGALYVVFLATLASAQDIKKILPSLSKLYICSAVIMSILSLIQVMAGIWLSRNQVLLCPGCTPTQFGFARPNVFTIEPQFFGSLLLAPMIMIIRRMFVKKVSRLEILALGVISLALFLSLSRGAIFALALALPLLVIVSKPEIKKMFSVASVILSSFIVCLLTQGAVAAANPNLNVSFRNATAASINQLSLGVIDLKVKKPYKAKVPVNKSTKKLKPKEADPNFTGYVEESTKVRLKLSKLAIQSWNDSPTRIVFGVGLGASGKVLHKEFPKQVNKREIVQNEYTELLLENGVLGTISFIAIITGLMYSLRQQKWQWAIIVAFLVQWNFYSGYPNALHIYLILIIMAVGTNSKKLKA